MRSSLKCKHICLSCKGLLVQSSESGTYTCWLSTFFSITMASSRREDLIPIMAILTCVPFHHGQKFKQKHEEQPRRRRHRPPPLDGLFFWHLDTVDDIWFQHHMSFQKNRSSSFYHTLNLIQLSGDIVTSVRRNWLFVLSSTTYSSPVASSV